MAPVRSVRETASDRACKQCQQRKTRCHRVDDRSACSYCERTGNRCILPERRERTALTRKNLEQAEERCRRLQEELERRSVGGIPETPNRNRAPEHSPQEGSGNGPAVVTAEPLSTPYEWNETNDIVAGDESDVLHGARDGMVSLGNVNEGAGYFGNSSGYRMYQSVSSLLSPDRQPSTQGVEESTYPQNRATSRATRGSDFHSLYSLSAKTVHEQLFTAFFTNYNSSYPILHESTFRTQYAARSQAPRDSNWHIIFFMVLAIGEWTLGRSTDEASLYYDAARSRFRIETLESGNMQNVQACLLMGNYLQKRDRPNTGYNFIGIAYRMALGLGLHRDVKSSTEVNLFPTHRRRALFWALYCFDSGFSITTGRPILVSDVFIDIKFPVNVDDTKLDGSHFNLTEVHHPTTYSALIAQARLAKIANKIYTQIMGVSQCPDIDHLTTVMEQLLQNWKHALPSYFTSTEAPDWFVGPRQIVFWKQSNLHMLLLHASQKHQPEDYDKIAIGRRYRAIAVEIVEDISSFCQKHYRVLHLGLSWYAIYFLLQAALAVTVDQARQARIANANQSDLINGLHDYEDTIMRAEHCLTSLCEVSSVASRSLSVLRRLHQTVKESSASPEAMVNAYHSPRVISSSGSAAAPSRLPPQSISSIAPVQPLPTVRGHDTFGTASMPYCPHNETDGQLQIGDWGVAADPSFHTFFDGLDNINDVFAGVYGFPSTLEREEFSYEPNNIFF